MGRRKRRRVGYVPGECKLCGETKPLRDSHIIPRFVYEMQRGEHGESSVSVSNGVTEQAHKGETEPMLCAGCEGLLSKWETPASWLIKRSGWESVGDDLSLNPARPKGAWVTINRYSEIKLFALSYLWRAHHSNLDTYQQFTLTDEAFADIEATLKPLVEGFKKTMFQKRGGERVFERPRLEGLLHPECYPLQLFVNSFAVDGRLIDEVTIPPSVRTRDEDGEVSYVDFVMVGVVFRVFMRDAYPWLASQIEADQRSKDMSIIRPGRSLVLYLNERDNPKMFEDYWSFVKGHVGGA